MTDYEYQVAYSKGAFHMLVKLQDVFGCKNLFADCRSKKSTLKRVQEITKLLTEDSNKREILMTTDKFEFRTNRKGEIIE